MCFKEWHFPISTDYDMFSQNLLLCQYPGLDGEQLIGGIQTRCAVYGFAKIQKPKEYSFTENFTNLD
jgi:hypothetical protein